MSEANSVTVNWFSMGTGTVGITKGQTMRLSVVNSGPGDINVIAAMTLNPKPLCEEASKLHSGESRQHDIEADSLRDVVFDKSGRIQIRAFVRSDSPTALANVEVFDKRTGRTSVLVPLQAVR